MLDGNVYLMYESAALQKHHIGEIHLRIVIYSEVEKNKVIFIPFSKLLYWED